MKSSFSCKVKNELCNIQENSFGYLNLELLGMLLFSKKISVDHILFVTESKNVLKRLSILLAKDLGVTSDIVTRKNFKKDNFSLLVPYESDRKIVLDRYGVFLHSDDLIKHDIFQNSNNIAAFLRGCFLFGGNVTNPSTGYHLEWHIQNERFAQQLKDILENNTSLSINAGILARKNAYVIYIKDFESITDILTFIGAPICAMDVIQIKMLKEVRNDVNRTTNFETANLSKTVTAATHQISAIEKIKKQIGINNLPPELAETAQLRILYPDMSLNDLGKKLCVPLSRSGVNHRLRRIIEISKNI